MKKSELKKLIKEVLQEETTNLDQVVKQYFGGARSFNKLSSIINNFQDDFTVSDKEIEEYLLSQSPKITKQPKKRSMSDMDAKNMDPGRSSDNYGVTTNGW